MKNYGSDYSYAPKLHAWMQSMQSLQTIPSEEMRRVAIEAGWSWNYNSQEALVKIEKGGRIAVGGSVSDPGEGTFFYQAKLARDASIVTLTPTNVGWHPRTGGYDWVIETMLEFIHAAGHVEHQISPPEPIIELPYKKLAFESEAQSVLKDEIAALQWQIDERKTRLAQLEVTDEAAPEA